jgi:hypothetical protein
LLRSSGVSIAMRAFRPLLAAPFRLASLATASVVSYCVLTGKAVTWITAVPQASELDGRS